MLKIKIELLNALSILLLKELKPCSFIQVYLQNYDQKHLRRHITLQTDYLQRYRKEKHHLKLGTRESLTFPTYVYITVMYILLITKLRLKAKWHLAHRLVYLWARKQRINEGFEMVPGFLSEET